MTSSWHKWVRVGLCNACYYHTMSRVHYLKLSSTSSVTEGSRRKNSRLLDCFCCRHLSPKRKCVTVFKLHFFKWMSAQLFYIKEMSSVHNFISSFFIKQSLGDPDILHSLVFFSLLSVSVQTLCLTRTRMRMQRLCSSLVTSQEWSWHILGKARHCRKWYNTSTVIFLPWS